MIKVTYCVGIVILGIALWWTVWVVCWMTPGTFKQEIVKVGVQVLVFALAGGGIKLLLDQAEAHRLFRSEVLQQLGQTHKDVYRIRRLIGVVGNEEERLKLLGELMDARQNLGSIYHDVRISKVLKSREPIRKQLQEIRMYMEEVIEGGLVPKQDPAREGYEDFLDFKNPASRYEKDFKAHYTRIKELVDPGPSRVDAIV